MVYKAFQDVELFFQTGRMREEVPEISVASLVGDGFGKLVKHFAYEPVFYSGEMAKPEDYPILHNAEISRRWGLDSTSAVPASRGERAWQEGMLVQRHLYLVRLAVGIMDEIDGIVPSHGMPMRQSTLPTPPALAARFAARGYVVVGTDGVRTPTPAALLDKDFLTWGGCYICQHCFKGEDYLKLHNEGKMLFCDPCRKIERAWTFCSAACQKKNWKSHKATCGRLFTESLETPIFPPADSDADSASKHPIKALLAQQIALQKQNPTCRWNVQLDPGPLSPRKESHLIAFLPEHVISRQLYDEFRDVAIATHEPVAIAWLFASIVTYLGPTVGLPDMEGEERDLSVIYPTAFTTQFLAHFDLPFDALLAALPSTTALLARSIEHEARVGPQLLKFTDGKWPGYVVSSELRMQHLAARDLGPMAVWAVSVPPEQVGGSTRIHDAVAPPTHKAHKALKRAFGEGTIGTVDAVAALFVEIVALCNFGVGQLQFVSLEDFKKDYCKSWRLEEKELDSAVLVRKMGAVSV